MPIETSLTKITISNDPIENFQQYLRIKTVHPTPDYETAILFLKNYAEALQLPSKCVKLTSGFPLLIITLEGMKPWLPSLVLNSHMDVVPVFPEHWKCDPFSGLRLENGNIYGRGTQDMKSVGIQYLEAIRRLKNDKKKFLRNIHLLFVPEEELGGTKGVMLFVQTQEFKNLNLGFCLDEGLASPTNIYNVFYGERCAWRLKIICTGDPGHGSLFIKNNAAEKFRKVVNKFLDFRDQEEKRLESDPELTLGDVTTVNLTIIEGGIQQNCIPPEFSAVFDIRISPSVNLEEFDQKVQSWLQSAGEGVRCEVIQKFMSQKLTPITDDNPWWNAFNSICKKRHMKIKTQVFPAATDAKYFRQLGYPAIGFSPMINTPVLLHDDNEFLNEKVFLDGIDIYYDLIQTLANVPVE